MEPEDYEEYSHKELEYLIRKSNSDLQVGRFDKKPGVIVKAVELGLDQAAVDAFFADPEIQDDIKDKSWCSTKVLERLNAVANNAVPAGNTAPASIAPTSNTTQNPFHSTSSSSNGFSAIPRNLKAEIIAKSHECQEAEMEEDFFTLNDLIGEREILYERAQRINPIEFETFRLERDGPQDIFDERLWEERVPRPRSIPDELKAEIIAKSRECADARMEEDQFILNQLRAEREVLYIRARYINAIEFDEFRTGLGGPEEIYEDQV
jgi:hypothetical protein